MLAAYLICLIVGGGLLLVSTVFASHAGADINADVDFHIDASSAADLAGAGADAGAHFDAPDHSAIDGHHVHSTSLASWFSIQFVVYFLAVFGLVGATLSRFSFMGSGAVLATAIASGLIVGQGVHQVLRYLRRSSGNSEMAVRDYLNQPGRVTIAINAAQRGEVAVNIRGTEQFIGAETRRPDDRFQIGDGVVVVGYRNGRVEVISRKEHEFLDAHEEVGRHV